jgi:hypothetical protein
MKKIVTVMIFFGLALSVFSRVEAGNGNGMGGGCSNCMQSTVPADPFRKFQSDTIDLRQEMMIKRFEMQRENLKGTPDNAKIAALQAEIKAIQFKIQAIHTESGLPVDKCDGECGQKMMGGCGKNEMGGCDKGPCRMK